jgi:hypothetical protein
MVFVILAVARTRDIYKLTVIFVMNFYTITVLGYGPASGLLVITMGFSEVFGRKLKTRTFSAESNAIGRQPLLRVASG